MPSLMPRTLLFVIPLLLLVVVLTGGFGPRPAEPEWFDSGHRVVAAVAWAHMTPKVRSSVVSLLRQAPPDAGLANLEPEGASDPQSALFIEASTWPDVVRDRERPDRRERYHRGQWHYVNHFWTQSPDGPLPLTHLESVEPNATERLTRFAETVTDSSINASERAVHLAWIIHLVGDLHQPLHASSRVTRTHPDGDRGGSAFSLGNDARAGNLHTYWDGILDLSYDPRNGESDLAYASRLAGRILHHDGPLDSLAIGSNPTDFAAWAQESTEIAQLAVYLPIVERGEMPPDVYRRHTLRLSELRLRQAGLRLAALLNHLFR